MEFGGCEDHLHIVSSQTLCHDGNSYFPEDSLVLLDPIRRQWTFTCTMSRRFIDPSDSKLH